MDKKSDNYDKSLYYFNLLSVDEKDFETNFIKSPEEVIINLNESIKGFNEKWNKNVNETISYNIKKNFIDNYKKLNPEQKNEFYFLIDFNKQFKDNDSFRERIKIPIKVSLKEYYHGTTKEFFVKMSALKIIHVKIIIKPGCQKIFHFSFFDVVLEVEPLPSWSYDGLNLIYKLSQEEIRKKSFTHLSGKVFSVPHFGEEKELTFSDQGLSLNDYTGSLTLISP
ncbi:hypothetical protein EDI_124040 [Entamoeba dispar SAW760]|uniref:Uncharacterized protein n=1 Tax=Entamoeba dispar (strain ATCC PRA-260 / SAW760) TaxID=370354 RepID=B0ER30_ENTDS|nr:uncharacterized protein EDI_124040 [Entamoeba dispar SAW760]EDR23039.1 hypothetical protein EDI_124040 [Entamoeba dispar SAW760]|eukprot:EDR23039.1 hypothetical protein EDI_124040 [Entamoeba dispar SAW760]